MLYSSDGCKGYVRHTVSRREPMSEGEKRVTLLVRFNFKLGKRDDFLHGLGELVEKMRV
jgi:hypothetical protein